MLTRSSKFELPSIPFLKSEKNAAFKGLVGLAIGSLYYTATGQPVAIIVESPRSAKGRVSV